MKKTLLFLGITVLAASVSAQDPTIIKGKQIGTSITSDNLVDVNKLVELMKTTETVADIKVTGKVVEVCQKKGCWMKIENPAGEPIHVMFKDYALFMPKDLTGKNVVLEGKSYISYTPVEELQHYAEDAGKTKEEISKITEAKREVRVEAWAVVILAE